uniref:Uncharacterized protein n=1 Tax=Panagrolaimus sp. PS1159 TaxID=55785 RepID=A0AC35FZP3_9BILA
MNNFKFAALFVFLAVFCLTTDSVALPPNSKPPTLNDGIPKGAVACNTWCSLQGYRVGDCDYDDGVWSPICGMNEKCVCSGSDKKNLI